MSDVLIPTAEIRRLAEAVQPGECITFPNGLVVDKRIVIGSGQTWTAPASPAQPNAVWGATCAKCGQWMTSGSTHYCYGTYSGLTAGKATA